MFSIVKIGYFVSVSEFSLRRGCSVYSRHVLRGNSSPPKKKENPPKDHGCNLQMFTME